MASVMVLGLVGCGKEPDSAQTVAKEVLTATEEDSSFEYKGTTFSLNDDALAVIDTISSKGTLYDPEGDEHENGVKMYDFDMDEENQKSSISVATFENDGKTAIGYVAGCTADFKTGKGIGVGSSLEEVKAAYGEPGIDNEYKNTTFMNPVYQFENFSIMFYLRDNRVDSIVYSHNNFDM